jgi:hypothetical protein
MLFQQNPVCLFKIRNFRKYSRHVLCSIVYKFAQIIIYTWRPCVAQTCEFTWKHGLSGDLTNNQCVYIYKQNTESE